MREEGHGELGQAVRTNAAEHNYIVQELGDFYSTLKVQKVWSTRNICQGQENLKPNS